MALLQNRPKVIVVMKGGIGNQFFCYAAARRLTLVNAADLVIDDVSGFAVDKLYQRKYYLDHFNIAGRPATVKERLKRPIIIHRNWMRIINRWRPFFKRTYLEDRHLSFDSRLLDFQVKGTLYLDGYWQSENYFKDIENVIKKDLAFKPSFDPYTEELACKIEGCTAIAIHRRWFDPSGENYTHNLPFNYYVQAIEKIERQVPNGIFFLFSDQPTLAAQELSYLGKRLVVVERNNNRDYTCDDLWLMSKCQHFIIANSTFSWWGAWLGEKEGSIVIAPDVKITGITAWGFPGLIPERWQKLSVS